MPCSVRIQLSGSVCIEHGFVFHNISQLPALVKISSFGA